MNCTLLLKMYPNIDYGVILQDFVIAINCYLYPFIINFKFFITIKIEEK